jgi:hypothetical protein
MRRNTHRQISLFHRFWVVPAVMTAMTVVLVIVLVGCSATELPAAPTPVPTITALPTDTPKPTDTSRPPRPTNTPKPTSTSIPTEPIEPTETPPVSPTEGEPPRISLQDFKALYDDSARRPLILDVRSSETYAEGHIEGAISFPEADVDARVGELPRDRLIVAYCQ